jgi:hypothetical protein
MSGTCHQVDVTHTHHVMTFDGKTQPLNVMLEAHQHPLYCHVVYRLVWERGCGCVSKKFEFFFLLKFNMVCMFWIVLMCWCQKWFFKKMKKHHWHVFWHEKLFEKHPQPHCQTRSMCVAKLRLRFNSLFSFPFFFSLFSPCQNMDVFYHLFCIFNLVLMFDHYMLCFFFFNFFLIEFFFFNFILSFSLIWFLCQTWYSFFWFLCAFTN